MRRVAKHPSNKNKISYIKYKIFKKIYSIRSILLTYYIYSKLKKNKYIPEREYGYGWK